MHNFIHRSASASAGCPQLHSSQEVVSGEHGSCVITSYDPTHQPSAAQVTVRDAELQQEVRVVNSGDRDLSFTAALHSYFRVGDIAQVGNHPTAPAGCRCTAMALCYRPLYCLVCPTVVVAHLAKVSRQQAIATPLSITARPASHLTSQLPRP
jgi:hypothetical protein